MIQARPSGESGDEPKFPLPTGRHILNAQPLMKRLNHRQNPPQPPGLAGLPSKWRVTSCLLILAGGLSQLRAATTVSGSVSGDWTPAGSPYLVVGDTLIIPGKSLTIQPNVEVLFQGPYVFEVNGSLHSAGTAAQRIVFAAANAATKWGGLYFNECGPGSWLAFCQISGSTNSGIRIKNSTPTIRNCVVANNSSPTGGGGIYARIKTGKFILTDCLITNNTAKLVAGGGVNLNGPAEISYCRIAGNQAHIGAAFYLEGRADQNGEVLLKNSDISGNTASYVGGGFYSSFVPASLVNCKVNTNNSAGYGAGFYAEGSGAAAKFINCTLAGNNYYAIYMGSSQPAYVTNSVLFYNYSGGAQIAGGVAVSYSNVQGGIQPGTGNISFNPSLDPASFELLPGSVCIDSGHPAAAFNDTCLPPSKGGVRNDLGAYGGPGACGGVGPRGGDSDNDGLPDEWELQYFGNLNFGANDDPDGDQLINADEYTHQTDPAKKDTDGDGYHDLAEIQGGSDPLDPNSVPLAMLTIQVKQVELQFIVGYGRTNLVQASSNLGNWTTVEQVIGTGSGVSRVYNVTNGMRYFRLTQP